MMRLTREQIREIQEMKNAANVAGLIMANPPMHRNEKEGGKDNVQSHTDWERQGSNAMVYDG